MTYWVEERRPSLLPDLCPQVLGYGIITVLITVAWWYSLKFGNVIHPSLFFLFKIAVAIQDLLWFHVNFRILCSSSEKNVMGNLIGIALNLQLSLGKIQSS